MYNKKKILSLVVARAGSKGLKNKNIKLFNGKAMVHWSIIASKKSKYVDHTLVSSDSNKVIKIAKKLKADAPFKRPAFLSKDNSPIKDVIFHAVSWLRKKKKKNFDFLLLLQATSPLRTYKHIDDSIKFYFKNMKNSKDTMVSVAKANPKTEWLVKMKKKYLRFVFNKKKILSRGMRQDIEQFFIPNGAIFFCNLNNFKGNFYTNKTLCFEMDKKFSIDIDTQEDISKFLFNNKDLL